MDLVSIKGISEKRVKELNGLNVNSVEELVKFFPRSYLDLTKLTPISESYNYSTIFTIAKIESEPQVFNSSRIKYVKVWCTQGADTFSVVWFNMPYVASKLKRDKYYYFYGRVQNKFGQISLTNPMFEEADNNVKLKGLIPVYKIKGSLTQSLLRYATKSATSKVEINSVIPDFLQKKYGLTSLKNAYKEVHAPSSEKSLLDASNRIATEEYFSLITAFKIIKGDKKCVRNYKYSCTAQDLKAFISKFPYEFTEGQKTAVNEIFSDMRGLTVMNRLLQGDVGSGKTAVSMCALFMAFKSGYQSCLLSPTEVLAKQNYSIACKYLGKENVCFLSGSTPLKEKKEIKQKLKNGDIKIIVGTHALIEKDVEFKNLALFVCDEQQRFGVAQRSALKDKGFSCDTLVMSATPIPRTLSLIFYGDLDISTILDKPKARAEIKTSVVPKTKYADMLNFISVEIKRGRRAYFVCPKIEGDEEGTVMSVTELYEELKNLLPSAKLSLLHGKMKDKEKTQIMEKFKSGEFDAVVSTTVIEVGIDVPEASVMVIFNAERFGLSQLHQLRGRVGRSDILSYCFLLSDNSSDKTKERLNAIKTLSDGFKISEIDYDMRGGGDILGERQSGRFIGDLGGLKYSSSAIFLAKKLSDETFESGYDNSILRKIALERYEKLKDVTMN